MPGQPPPPSPPALLRTLEELLQHAVVELDAPAKTWPELLLTLAAPARPTEIRDRLADDLSKFAGRGDCAQFGSLFVETVAPGHRLPSSAVRKAAVREALLAAATVDAFCTVLVEADQVRLRDLAASRENGRKS